MGILMRVVVMAAVVMLLALGVVHGAEYPGILTCTPYLQTLVDLLQSEATEEAQEICQETLDCVDGGQLSCALCPCISALFQGNWPLDPDETYASIVNEPTGLLNCYPAEGYNRTIYESVHCCNDDPPTCEVDDAGDDAGDDDGSASHISNI